MLLSLRKDGLTSLFKEVRVFKVNLAWKLQLDLQNSPPPSKRPWWGLTWNFHSRLKFCHPRGRSRSQWNPKYGCRGTQTARFALIVFVAWKRLADSTLGKLLVHPEYGWNALKRYGLEGFPSHSSDCSGGFFPQYSGVSPRSISREPSRLRVQSSAGYPCKLKFPEQWNSMRSKFNTTESDSALKTVQEGPKRTSAARFPLPIAIFTVLRSKKGTV